MAEEALKIRIGADIVEVTKSIDALETEFKLLGQQLRAVNPGSAQFTQLSQEFNRQAVIIQKVNEASRNLGTGYRGLATNAAGANQALVNVGRVVQDAPFGLIGVANNIDPLIQSFQQLRAQTGSNAAAFKALAGSLLGPAGFAIAISSITSLLIAFGPQIQAAINKVSEFDRITGEGLKTIGESAKKAQLDIERLTNLINGGISSAERQQDALNRINNELNKYGLNIKSVADFQRESAGISQLFIQLKQEEARAQFLAAQAAEQYARQLAESFKVSKAAAGGAINVNNPLDFFRSLTVSKGNKAIKEATDLQRVFESAVKESEKRIELLIQQFSKINGVVEQFGKNKKTATEKTKELTDVLTAQQAVIVGVAFQIAAENKELRDNILLQQELIRLGNQRANQLQQAGRNVTTADLSLIREQGGGRSPLEQLELLQGEFTKVNESAKLLNDTISNGINAGIDQFFNALANNQDPFKALQQSVKRLVVELAAAVVKTLILKAIANSIAPGSGELVGQAANLGGRANRLIVNQLRVLG